MTRIRPRVYTASVASASGLEVAESATTVRPCFVGFEFEITVAIKTMVQIVCRIRRAIARLGRDSFPFEFSAPQHGGIGGASGGEYCGDCECGGYFVRGVPALFHLTPDSRAAALFLAAPQILDFGLAPGGVHLVGDDLADEEARKDHAFDKARLPGDDGDGVFVFPLGHD